jgi:hypothetical protein
MTTQISMDEVARYAQQAHDAWWKGTGGGIDGPRNFAGADYMYRTHYPVMTWAEQSDDVLSESNYHVARELLQAWSEDTDDLRADETEDVIDAGIRHWACGQCSQLFVRVYLVKPEGEDVGIFTRAWIAACEMLSSLENYPVLDEGDYGEREDTQFWQYLLDRMYPYADDAESREDLANRVSEAMREIGVDARRADDLRDEDLYAALAYCGFRLDDRGNEVDIDLSK